MIQTTTHINLRGDARAALALYQSVFGGETTLFTYADAHAVTNPDEADQVMWGQVLSPDGFHVMAFDVPSARPYDQGAASYFVSVRGDEDEIKTYWGKLADVSTVLVPLGPAGWSPLYGMLTDPHGVTWVLDSVPQQA
jgi:PhnB protein